MQQKRFLLRLGLNECTKNLSVNFDNNRKRFEEGKHFVKLEGEDLRAFKNQPEVIGLVPKRSSHLILWTERGAARHAKMLETDAARDVFGKSVTPGQRLSLLQANEGRAKT